MTDVSSPPEKDPLLEISWSPYVLIAVQIRKRLYEQNLGLRSRNSPMYYCTFTIFNWKIVRPKKKIENFVTKVFENRLYRTISY